MRVNSLMAPALAFLMVLGSGSLAVAAPKGCPPGLAKKSPACVPPGHAKSDRQHRYHVGDVISQGDYTIIRNPDRYGLNPRHSYYRVGDQVFRVDRETREILDLIGAVAAVLD